MGGLAEDCVVLTADGALPVAWVAPGDRVVTRAGMLRVAAVRVTAGLADVVDLAPSSLGHGRPGARVTLAADQPVMLRDWRAKALFGTAQAVVPAGRLADGQAICRRRAEVRLYELLFDRPAIMQAAGIEVACQAVVVTA